MRQHTLPAPKQINTVHTILVSLAIGVLLFVQLVCFMLMANSVALAIILYLLAGIGLGAFVYYCFKTKNETLTFLTTLFTLFAVAVWLGVVADIAYDPAVVAKHREPGDTIGTWWTDHATP